MNSGPLRGPMGRLPFRRLGLSYAISEVGDWVGIVALSVLVFDRTGSALAVAGLFLGTRFVPALLSSPIAARGIRPPPRFALPVIYCGEAAALAGLALLVAHFSLAGVIVVATLEGTLALTGRVLIRVVVGALLEPPGELRAGNALLNFVFTGGAAIGPVLAGLLVAGLGVQTALLLDAAAFYAIAWILLSAGPLPQPEPEPANTRSRVRAGLAHIREKVFLRRLLLAQSLAFVFFAAVIPVEVVYAKQTLGAGDFGYGLILGSWGAGMIFGSIVFALARRARLSYLLFFSTLAVAAGYLGLGLAPTLAAACAAAVFGGAGNGIQWVSVISAVQKLTVPSAQGPVFLVLEAIASTAPGIGFVLGGVIANSLSVRATFFFAGGGILLITAIAAPFLERRFAPAPLISPRSGPRVAGAVGLAPNTQSPDLVLPSLDEPRGYEEIEIATFYFLLGTAIAFGTVAWSATHSVLSAGIWALGAVLVAAALLALTFKWGPINRRVAAALRWIVGR